MALPSIQAAASAIKLRCPAFLEMELAGVVPNSTIAEDDIEVLPGLSDTGPEMGPAAI